MRNLIKSPYQIRFKYPTGSEQRESIKRKIDNNKNFDLYCTITSGSQIKKTNKFSISLQQSTDLNLQEKLFGDADTVYVSRDQLVELGNLVYTELNIIEEYEIDSEKFSNEFVKDMIALVGEKMQPVNFKEALESLSKFSLNFQGDIDPDRITRELSKVFTLEKIGNKEHIVLDKAYDEQLEKEKSSGTKVNAEVSYGIVSVKAGVEHVQAQKYKTSKSEKNKDDQLKELNSLKENNVEYEFSGQKIIPKSLKVAKLTRSKFENTLSFSRIKHVYVKAQFDKKFSLSTQNVLKNPEFVNVMTQKLKACHDRIDVLEKVRTFS